MYTNTVIGVKKFLHKQVASFHFYLVFPQKRKMSANLMELSLANAGPDRKKTIPGVGFGCWKLPKETASDLVFKAIEIGYRHIDSACDYGNEKEVD